MRLMTGLHRLLIRNIAHMKAQFLAVSVVVALGAALWVAIEPAGNQLAYAQQRYYEDSAFADLVCSVQSAPPSSIADVLSLPSVHDAEGRYSIEVPLLVEGEERVTVNLIGVPADGERINVLHVHEGRRIRHPDREAMVLTQFARARGIEAGDELAVSIGGEPFYLTVCGQVSSAEFIYLVESGQSIMPADEQYGVLYVDERLIARWFDTGGTYNEILLRYGPDVQRVGMEADEEQERDLLDAVERRLAAYGVWALTSRKDQLSHVLVSEEIDGLRSMGKAVSTLFLLVAASVIAMMVSRMVKRERNSIGVLKAIGYSSGDVLAHYVRYALVIGAAGALFGALLGIALSRTLTTLLVDFFEIPHYGAQADIGRAVVAFFLACGLCSGAGAFAARGVLRQSPASALQPEAPRQGRRILVERIPLLWQRLRFSQKWVVRNVLRNRKRSVFVASGVALTCSLLLFTLTMPDLIDEMLVRQHTVYRTMDFEVTLFRPVPAASVQDVLYELPDRSRVEGRIEQVCRLTHEHRERTVSVIGLSAESDVVHLQDRRGQALVPRPGSVILTENVAGALGVVPGDRIRIRALVPGGGEAEWPVRDIAVQMMGANAYLEVSDMGGHLFGGPYVNGLYVNADDAEAVRRLQRADNVSAVFSADETGALIEEYLELTRTMMVVMIAMSGVLGFVIVYNATAISISERRRELASLRVMGFRRQELFRMMAFETALISAVGFVSAVPLSLWMLKYTGKAFSTDLYTLHMKPTPWAGGCALMLTMLFLVAAQAATYEKIRTLDYLQALR